MLKIIKLITSTMAIQSLYADFITDAEIAQWTFAKETTLIATETDHEEREL